MRELKLRAEQPHSALRRRTLPRVRELKRGGVHPQGQTLYRRTLPRVRELKQQGG